MLKKTEKSMDFIKRWYQIACIYELINDEHHQEEFPQFRDHRHDQSLFSLLVKREKSGPDTEPKPIVIGDETYFPNDWQGQGGTFPIWGTRYR
jgi:hypothetical protein